MSSLRIRELLSLFVGDLGLLFISLWLTLAIRYLEIPGWDLLMLHLVPFSVLFIVWILLFFIAGLYDQHTMFFKSRLPERILRAQTINVVIAAIFFFSVPIFGIAPKTNLILYLVVSSALMIWWRGWFFPRISGGRRSSALIVGGGSEIRELVAEVNDNHRYPFYFSERIVADTLDGGAVGDRIFSVLRDPHLAFVVIDLHHRKLVNILPHLYKPIFSNVRFIDMRELYEDIFERTPLSILGDTQAMEDIATRTHGRGYEVAKRVIDIVGACLMALVALIIAPLIWIAMRIEGPGPLIIEQARYGKHFKKIRVYKFRSMTHNETASGAWIGESKNKITRVGAFLRKTSLDEFPQFINILKGDMSLIGPRNDTEGIGDRLAEAIPGHNVRYTVAPGITGWAQINQQYRSGNISPQSVEEMKMRLMYDLYYIKNRSLMLDIMIALKTIKRMVFRSGS